MRATQGTCLARGYAVALVFPSVALCVVCVTTTSPTDWRTTVAITLLTMVLAGALAAFTGTRILRMLRALQTTQVRNAQLFDTAINRINQGLCFFDVDEKLMICNDKYMEMYKLPLDSVRPGMTVQEIVAKRYAMGRYPNLSPEQYVNWRYSVETSGQTVDRMLEMNDGRIFLVHHEPLPGGGWVATHDDITEQQLAHRKIERLARQDTLTGLSNRVFFEEQVRNVLEGTSRDHPTALLYVDLDRFKAVNDTHGHQIGDALLRKVAERMHLCVRATDHIARLGGDEFAILLPRCPSARAEEVAQRLVDQLALPFTIDVRELRIGASVGVAMAYAPDVSIDLWLRSADAALYESKHAGRGRFVFTELAEAEALTV